MLFSAKVFILSLKRKKTARFLLPPVCGEGTVPGSRKASETGAAVGRLPGHDRIVVTLLDGRIFGAGPSADGREFACRRGLDIQKTLAVLELSVVPLNVFFSLNTSLFTVFRFLISLRGFFEPERIWEIDLHQIIPVGVLQAAKNPDPIFQIVDKPSGGKNTGNEQYCTKPYIIKHYPKRDSPEKQYDQDFCNDCDQPPFEFFLQTVVLGHDHVLAKGC